LKELVAIRDETIAAQNRDLFGIHTELEVVRCSLMSQGIQVQKLSQLFDSKTSEASSQAEEIRSLKAALTEAKATTDKLKAKHEFDFKRFRSVVMPCYYVGRNIRHRKINQDIPSLNPVLRGLERDYDAILEGNKAAHDGNCLADATVILFDHAPDEANRFTLRDTLHDTEQFKASYGVHPIAVFINRNFDKFKELLNWYDNMRRYVSSSKCSPVEGTRFLESTKGLIQRVHPLEHFNSDEEMERDSEATVLYDALSHFYKFHTEIYEMPRERR
jgi:hypothetical protein